mgnify:CR=1 FL=1
MPITVGKDQSVFKRVTCRNCGTINEYAPGEVRNLWNGCDYSGGSDGAFTLLYSSPDFVNWTYGIFFYSCY